MADFADLHLDKTQEPPLHDRRWTAWRTVLVIALIAKRKNLPIGEARPPLPIAWRIVSAALPALAMPPLVLGGIFAGFVTPTEAAVVASGYAFLLGKFWYRELSYTHLPDILWESGRQTAQVMFIIAAASPFGWVLIQQQIPNALLEAMFSLSSEPWIILVIINAVLLLLGFERKSETAVYFVFEREHRLLLLHERPPSSSCSREQTRRAPARQAAQ